MNTATKLTLFLILLVLINCSPQQNEPTEKTNDYLDYTGKDDLLSGGIKMIPIKTAKGEFKVWTKRVGNNPTKKVLLLHGGPGFTHEYFECFDSYFPTAGIEYYYYDQLGSYYSDKSGDSSLWTIEHYVEEVEQVRKALGLNKDNFYLLGHSWGGILASEYALKYQQNLKGLIISNMMMSIPDYVKYANEVLGPQLDPDVLTEIKKMEAAGDYLNPRYSEIVMENYYPKHVIRVPIDQWPDPFIRAATHANMDIYVAMQGPSEFGIVGDVVLKDWDRTADLPKITVPTLSIGGAHDTMDPKHMEWISTQVKNGTYLHCPEGSHMSMYDDQKTYFEGLIGWVTNN